jgi:hypothetical protein
VLDVSGGRATYESKETAPVSDILTGAPAANFIAGQWVPSRSASVDEGRSLCGPSDTLGRLRSPDGDDVAAAVAAAVEADRTWSRQDV